jgi:polysaccharide biosynthesis protein PslH
MRKRFGDSAAKPAALFLTPEAPYPLAGGGQMRSASLLEYLAKHFHVDVIVFREPGAADPVCAIPSGLVREIKVISLPYHSKQFHARALRNFGRVARQVPPLVDRFSGFDRQIAAFLHGRSYQTAMVEHFWCATYADIVQRHSEKTILDLHNVESVLLARCAESERWPGSLLLRRFGRACAQLERKWFPRFSTLMVSSATDRDAVAAIAGHPQVIVYPNAIPRVPLPAAAKREEIVFAGNFDYHPNRTAIRYFHEQIWSGLRDRFPSLRWTLVGRNHEDMERRLAGDPRIQFTGPVRDAVSRMASARLAVVPLLAGSGTRIKIIEAWAAGLPVVSTSLGAEGLPAQPGRDLLIADNPRDFIEAVASVLESEALRTALSRNGRLLYESQLTWAAAWETLNGFIIED